MRAVLASLACLPALALATITITSPNPTDYWVQNISKTITWTSESSDPSVASIIIVNSDVDLLNGEYSIAEDVDIATQSFTITNVTIRVGDGYQVAFVNTSDHTNVYATGPTFEVRPAGTPPANLSAAANPPPSVSSSSSSSESDSSTPTGTSTNPPAPSGSANGALARGQNAFYLLAVCGVAGLASLVF